jgi:hypothetical protein
MDKMKLSSNGKDVLLAALVCAVLLLGGCETTKECSSGMDSSREMSFEDAGQNNGNLWTLIKRADDWVKANFW